MSAYVVSKKTIDAICLFVWKNMGTLSKPEIVLHRSTNEGEPGYPVKANGLAVDMFEMPQGNTELIKQCQKWIKNN